MNSRPDFMKIKEAVLKNVCAPDEDEWEELSTSKIIRTSTKREGDAELGMILLIGIAHRFGYSFNEISLLASVEQDEYQYKLQKFNSRMKAGVKRFLVKHRLIINYLRLKYGITTVLPVAR